MKKTALTFLIFLLAACSKVSHHDTLRMNLGTEPPTLDWNILSDYNSMEIVANIMVGLTRFSVNNEGEVISVPGCAKSWDISEDGLVYTFHLDPNARWTDGKQVSAQDFIDSYTRLLDPETAAPYAELLSMINLEQSYAINDQSLVIKLKHPVPYFIHLSSLVITYPIRLDLIKRYGKAWTDPEKLVSNGPYKLKQWQHEYKILLERNDDFFQEPAKIKYLKYFMVAEQASAYTLFLNDQFDWIDNRSIPTSEQRKLSSRLTAHRSPRDNREPSAMSHEPEDDVQRHLLLRNSFVGFNQQHKPLNDQRVRQAMSFAINRKLFAEIRSKGDLANSTWIPPSLGNYLDMEKVQQAFQKKYQRKFSEGGYYPELARKLLAEAGFPNGKDFPELELAVPSREDVKLQAEALQAMWSKELNIKVKITTMEWKVFLARLRNDTPDLFRSNWGADYPDPDTFMNLFLSNSPFNEVKFFNDRYDKLVRTAAQSKEIKTRRKLYTEAEIILTQDQAAIAPLYIDRQTIIKKPWLKNFTYSPMDLVFLDKVEKD